MLGKVRPLPPGHFTTERRAAQHLPSAEAECIMCQDKGCRMVYEYAAVIWLTEGFVAIEDEIMPIFTRKNTILCLKK